MTSLSAPTSSIWKRLFESRGKAMIFLGIAICLAGIGAVLFAHQILVIDSGDVAADVIVVLGGGSDEQRPQRAAELFRQKRAPLVLISGTGDYNLNARLLEANGVPANRIAIENRSTSTLENARFSAVDLRKMGAHRVIIVTSWYHSRRALKCFQSIMPDIQFASCPSYWGYSTSEWHRSIGGHVAYEYVKLLGYWVCYGVRPF